MPPRAKKNVTLEPEFDPFSEPEQDTVPAGDEAQTEMRPPWEVSDETDVNDTDTDEKAKVIVTAEGKIVQTYKFGRDYDAPWLVNHSNAVVEALLTGGRTHDEVKDLSSKELFQLLMDDTARWGAYATAKSAPKGDNTGGTQNASQGGSQARSQGKPASAEDGPLGAQYCTHGKKKFWSKFDEQKKEMVQIYFCPAPKNSPDKCKNQYVN